ncbi:MAG: 50S ribosomal protein L25 [Patescibacteria group bacterium]
MAFTLNVQSKPRISNEDLRKQGIVPGIIYGGDRKEPTAVAVKQSEFQKLYDEAGESSLVDFSIDSGAPVKVLIQDVQVEPVKGKITHVDFRQINMNKEMTVDVELKFSGDPAAVRELGGTLVKPHSYVTIKCLPKDLMSEIEIDLSSLKTFSDAIRVQDILTPDGVVVVDEPEMVIAKVVAPLTEDELKAMEETVAPKIEDIEVEKKGKKEEEGEDDDKKEPAGKKDEKK